MCSSMSCFRRDQQEQGKRSPEVQSRSIKVFRCQLPRANPFYSSEGLAEDGSQQPLTAGAMLCDWCQSWKGDKTCTRCGRVRYCSGNHWTAHWRSSSSSHEVQCQQLESSGNESELAASNSLWPEYVITSEDESEFDEPISSENGSGNALVSRSRTEGSDGNLMEYFQYSSSSQARPLWPVSSARPSRAHIPRCNHCGGTRAFEFQVLSQLLYYFHVENDKDSLDWTTIAVYTCEASCEGGASYKEEFAWSQLVSESISHQ